MGKRCDPRCDCGKHTPHATNAIPAWMQALQEQHYCSEKELRKVIDELREQHMREMHRIFK